MQWCASLIAQLNILVSIRLRLHGGTMEDAPNILLHSPTLGQHLGANRFVSEARGS